MMTAEWLQTHSASLADLFEKKLKIRGNGLEAKLRRAGRRLPRNVRREAERLVAAERYAGHPRLMMQLDMAQLQAAHARCERYAKGVDLTRRRKDRALNIAAAIAFNLLVVSAAFIWYLTWAGHL